MSEVKFFRLRPVIFDSTLRGAHNEEPGGVTGATARDQTEFGRKSGKLWIFFFSRVSM